MSKRLSGLCLPVLVMAFSLLQSMAAAADELQYAGLTIDQATVISEPVELLVQDGDNYIKVTELFLPATVRYIPGEQFNPLPVAIQDGADTLQSEIVFEDCRQEWRWYVEPTEGFRVINIVTHEKARILVEPSVCHENEEMTTEAFDFFEWNGQKYTSSQDIVLPVKDEQGCEYTLTIHLTIHNTVTNTTSVHGCDFYELGNRKITEDGQYPVDTVLLANGDRQINYIDLTLGHTIRESFDQISCVEYTAPSGKIHDRTEIFEDTVKQADGCDKIYTINLTIHMECLTYDTVRYCRGLNTDHNEADQNDRTHIWVYRSYNYQDPSSWDYMEGAIIQGEPTRTLVDLQRAESNLRNHYPPVNSPLQPVETIAWSTRRAGTQTWTPLTVENAPQWIDAGELGVEIHFLCGEIYTTSIPTDIENTSVGQRAIKRVEDGKVVIFRGGVKYDILGNQLQ